jgi:dimethylargininase
MFEHAIVRPPAENFASGLTTVNFGVPSIELSLDQHQKYCAALKTCGLGLIRLEPDLDFPDSTFVEDAAVLTPHAAILTNPGAESRKGEIESIRPTLAQNFQKIYEIEAPGTLDGGDICEAGRHFFIGISKRTNIAGGRQLAGFLEQEGYTSSFVSVEEVPGILHLKSGIAYLGENTLVLIDALAGLPQFEGFEIVRVDPLEDYAANCVRVNNFVLIADGYPHLTHELNQRGFSPMPLDMTEYRKMDGGLSCLSLRF